MLDEVGNIEPCEILDTEPKRSAKYVYHLGTSASSTARAGISCEKEQSYIKIGRPHGHRYGKKPGDREYFIANSLKKKCEKFYLGIHDPFIRDEKFRKNMFDTGRIEEMCRKMDELADEDHMHHLTPEEIRDYRANWWIRSNKVGSDAMPVRHRPDFKQALSTLRQLKDKEDAAHQQRWSQSYSSSWWNWQESWWHSSYEHHQEDVPSTD